MNSDRAIRSITDLVVRCVDPDSIVLFGSVAQGRAGRGSDIDLFVLGSFSEPKPRRGLELRGLLERFPLSVDLHLLTPEEFEAEARTPHSLAQTIRRHGVQLYARPAAGAPVT
jgi:predicted nucleotidyltransferase